ncbi:predicted protein [Uncinocarpus reesii 1704]|uniref:FHA domain-containing protein n=1 Tax=Uncinocarpus reesii (strain UAMH 1704) TaxID=336963 RepID=C4JWU7_UNCRE|nr:uncharacterized protein UREG_06120 [Uncinocarpus reesii 1704]EEP81255.1 predicted protein [Uncinocarpus reesii 1704]
MDTKSMHGTWVNGIKLTSGRRLILEDGDLVTFGTKVARGSDAYEPLTVRLGLSWQKADSLPMNIPEKESERRSTNTFVVPDDDDEGSDGDFEIEVEGDYHTEIDDPKCDSPDVTSVAPSPNSCVGGQVVDSPITLPTTHMENSSKRDDSPLFVQDDDGDDSGNPGPVVEGSNVLDISDPGFYVEIDDSTSDESEDSGIESLEDQRDVLPDRFHSREAPFTETGDSTSATAADVLRRMGQTALPSTPESMHRDEKPTLPDYGKPLNMSTNAEAERPRLQSERNSKQPLRAPPYSPEQIRANNDVAAYLERVTMGCGTASLLRNRHQALHGSLAWPTFPQRPELSASPYMEGPFAGSGAPYVPMNTSHNRTGFGRELPLPPFESRGMEALQGNYEGANETSAQASGRYPYADWCNLDPKEIAPGSNGEKISARGNDVQDLCDQPGPGKKKSLKRKLDETDLSQGQEADASNSSEVLPDAQPHESSQKSVQFESLITEMPMEEDGSKTAPGTADNERPKKLAKMANERPSRMQIVARYAATAAAGAVVGGVGAIMALASLPADFFN